MFETEQSREERKEKNSLLIPYAGDVEDGTVREREEGAAQRAKDNNSNKPNQTQSGAAVHIAANSRLSIVIN